MVIFTTTPIPSSTTPINPVQRFEDFYRLFEETPGEYKYQSQIKNIDAKGGNALVILYEDLLAFDAQIAEMLKNDPEGLLDDAIEAFKNILKFESGGKLSYDNYFVRVATRDEKSPLSLTIRGLRSKNIDKLVWFKGITIRSSTIRPKLTKATFECMVCGATFEVVQLTSKIKWPAFCINKSCKAKAKSDFRLITKKSEFIDWQSITIQEVPEDLPAGRIPRSIQAILTYDLVDYIKPGDRVKIMGVFKSVLATSMRNMNSTLFKTFVHVNFVDPEDKSEDDIDITKEEKAEIEKLSKEPMIQKKIARSIAPTIYGRDDLKMACALSLFSGTKKKKYGGGYKRGDIHVLFVGDPGTGKSVHGNEKIYLGLEGNTSFNWKIIKIEDFIDQLIEENGNQVIKKKGTEILKMGNLGQYFTFSMNTNNLKTQKTRIQEISRHQNEYLIKIITKSGRVVLATPNHSFTTIKDGKLQTLDASQLNANTYLPIARKFNPPETFEELDLSQFFERQDLVSTRAIKNNTSSYTSNNMLLSEAATDSNITIGTMVSYIQNPPLDLNSNWIRCKYDTTWIPKKIELNESFGRIVGIFLAEGEIIKNSIRITNCNPEIIGLIEKDFIKIFERISRYDKDSTLQFHNASLARIFKILFDTGTQKKQLPDDFIFTPETFRINLLSAYFTGDGYIEKDGLYISGLTKSKMLAYSILDLLATLGIFATIRKRIIKSGEYKGYIFYKIILTGEEVIKFHNKIGFICSEKQNKLNCLIQDNFSTSRYQTNDIIPNFGNILQRIATDLGLKSRRGTWQRFFLAELRGKTQRQRAGRAYLSKKVRFFEELYEKQNKEHGKDLKWLRKLITSDVLWDQIKKIEILNKNTYVYDIGTEDDHFILAKGNIIAHNSEILKSSVDISPRGLYTSGKGSTAVGLTAAVIKDSDTGQMNLEAGAIVLANGGIAAIDEFDKMDSADRSALHEAMEQQTVSIAKAGIVATLKAETAVIAAANPHSGRYDIYKTPTQNIRLPPSLLSRFDLIFVVVDRPNRAEDAQMAEFILQSAMSNADQPADDEDKKKVAPISGELLKKYIKHAKRTCKPILTNDAKEKIKEFYLELRSDYDSEDAIVSILARNLDALVRLSEAHAKMALRKDVLKDDVDEIIKIFKRYLKDTGYDETTGKIDMDRIFVGQSRSKLNKLDTLLNRLKEIFEENAWKMLERKNIIQILDLEESLDEDFIKNALNDLTSEGTLYEPRVGYLKFTNKDEP
ncbi:MAG: hypothetical protein GF317_01720 [Candidatus Lokiarchaeota archaeon]|nr:hypothetical protein [Candidatus Lokiarchaeota archaeon]MBD3198659.1 hypothetical protein [Candidatus Lokiarchaeota archaeon]